MTIEKSPPAAHKAAARNDGPGAKAKAASTDAAPAAGSGGFMAILGALSDGATDTPALAAAPDTTLPDAALPVVGTPFDATALLQQSAQYAGGQSLQTAPGFASVATGSDAPAASGADPLTLAPDPGSAAAQAAAAALLAASGRPAAAQVSMTAAAAAPEAAAGPRLTGIALNKAVATPAADATAWAGTGGLPDSSPSSTHSLQHGGAHGRVGQGLAQADSDASATSTGGNPATAASERAEPARLMAALEQVKTAQPDKAPAPVFVPLLAKPEKTQGERSSAALKNADPTYAGTALGVSAPDFSASALQAPSMAPDLQAAEQVSYWVSQNVQNAELKLDGLGQSPVEVSISVQGKEAQIAFRTDEAATRGVLESAGAHLKDLLQREGLVLTGVSVGTSGSGDTSGGSERRARPNARQALIAPVQVASVDAGRRMGAESGRSVDLFV